MTFVRLELPCPRSSLIVASADPDLMWTMDDLLSTLNSIESKLSISFYGDCSWKKAEHPKEMGDEDVKPFVMRIPEEYGWEDSGSDDERIDGRNVTRGTRFSFTDLDWSESEASDDELHKKPAPSLMKKMTVEEAVLFEYELEYELKLKEEVRKKLSAFEAKHSDETQRTSTALLRLQKYIELRREMDRRHDKQYQRKIAEALDRHLSAVQRDHEQRSQIEERRIKDDAALEEARRKEKALLEEKEHFEKAKAEAEARAKAAKVSEAAQKAALEAAKKASEEAANEREAKASEFAKKEANEQKTVPPVENTRKMKAEDQIPKETVFAKQKGIRVLGADVALKAEAIRLKIYDEVEKGIALSSNKEFDRRGRQIARYLMQIVGIQQKVRESASQLIRIIRDPLCPPIISNFLFAKMVVAGCENPGGDFDGTAFACAHVILLVTSQVPSLMDFILAAFNKACIYTVPKHLQPSASNMKSKEFLKMIGYREENGRLESTDSYLNGVKRYMTLYAALIQMEIHGITNPYGLKEGWAWLARFLNKIPATGASAVALEAFLKMAGFSLHRRYGSQFLKILNYIAVNYLPKLKEGKDGAASDVIFKLEKYLQDRVYLREPDGRRLQTESLLSRELV